MTDIEEVYVRDLFKKHKGKELYKGLYSIGKKIYQDDGEIVNGGFVLDKEALEVLRAKIMAILIDDLPVKENWSRRKDSTRWFSLDYMILAPLGLPSFHTWGSSSRLNPILAEKVGYKDLIFQFLFTS